MTSVFLLIGYFLCGEQPEAIRTKLDECQMPTGATKRMLDATGIETNQLQLAQTEIFNSRYLLNNQPRAFSTATLCEAARATQQNKGNEIDAHLHHSGLSPEAYWHSEHWKCVELQVDEPPQ